MEDVDAICDRVIMINHGRKLFDGSIKSLKTKYARDKYLEVDFDTEIAREELEKMGKVVEYNGVRAVFAVARRDHAKLAAEVLTMFPVDNLDVKEIKLEDIILKHFTD
jgi:ABC-2 type transport system ATP-binding protein